MNLIKFSVPYLRIYSTSRETGKKIEIMRIIGCVRQSSLLAQKDGSLMITRRRNLRDKYILVRIICFWASHLPIERVNTILFVVFLSSSFDLSRDSQSRRTNARNLFWPCSLINECKQWRTSVRIINRTLCVTSVNKHFAKIIAVRWFWRRVKNDRIVLYRVLLNRPSSYSS